MEQPSKHVDDHRFPLGAPDVVKLVPIGLKEAALDSPSFRAAVLHYNSLIDQTEAWIDGYAKAATRVAAEAAGLDGLLSGFLASASPPKLLSEAIVDYDHTLLALNQQSEASKQWWSSHVFPLKKLETNVAERLRGFLQSDIKTMKETSRHLEQSQKAYDNLQARCAAQGRSKEPSALREDAFHLHEARKLYLKASLDFACAVPRFKYALDCLVIHSSCDQVEAVWTAQERSRSSLSRTLGKNGRVRAWAQNVSLGEKEHCRQLLLARQQIEESAESASRPSRDLDAYSISAPLGAIAGTRTGVLASGSFATPSKSERQGWLNLKLAAGKPTRTVWSRKWFYLEGGIFGWLIQGSRSGGVEESDRIGVLLCSVRLATTEERRFCFEVRWKDGTIILQAESAQDRLNWITTFENAKRDTLADASSAQPERGPGRLKDLAFAISPPNAPEFAASAADAGLGTEESNEKTSGQLGPSADQAGVIHRGSFDVSGSRRSTAVENDNNKEQATKAIQKFDLHRRTGPGATAAAPNNISASHPSTGGIATLVSASNMALPLGNVSLSYASSYDAGGRLLSAQPQNRAKVCQALPTSTLAPSTLANPPVATNLNWTATMLCGEKGVDMGGLRKKKKKTNVVNANVWGSMRYSRIQWLEQKSSMLYDSRTHVSKEEQESAVSNSARSNENIPMMPEHRKTISVDGGVADLQRAVVSSEERPFHLPAILKHQDAQFRLLFPTIAVEEKLVLVFRASWSFRDQVNLPGRVYVTTESIMFYSHHFGMVLTTGLALTRVESVSATSATGHDLLFLHLKENGQGASQRVAIQIFLEPSELLRRRLACIVRNVNSKDRLGTEALLSEMIQLENNLNEEAATSREDRKPITVATRLVDGNGIESNAGLQTRIVVDQQLGVSLDQPPEEDNTRFKLPNKPVIYQPDPDVWGSPVVESDFQISPKALFHVVFGDREIMWSTLYRQRRARNIRQGPWIREDGARLGRAFEFDIIREDSFGKRRAFKITDTQRVEVLSDHLCYVVSYRKTPWHLPHFQNLDMVTKVVISFVAKSRCKIAIHARTEWSPGSRPLLSATLIEERALQDIKSDVSDVADLIAEQARRIQRDSANGTKRAIELFGSIGQQAEVVEHSNEISPPLRALRFAMKQKSIAGLYWDGFLSLFKYALNLLLVAFAFVAEKTWDIVSANTVLVILLVASFVLNTSLSAQPFHIWLESRQATVLVDSLGIRDKLGLGHVVRLGDIDTIAQFPMSSNPVSMNGSCHRNFQVTALQERESTRLHRSRHRLQSYRHDLLVAMRIVNRIEYEMQLAEFEQWLRSELLRCNSAKRALSSWQTGAAVSNGSQDAQRRLEEYCERCIVESRPL